MIFTHIIGLDWCMITEFRELSTLYIIYCMKCSFERLRENFCIFYDYIWDYMVLEVTDLGNSEEARTQRWMGKKLLAATFYNKYGK